MVKLAFKIFYAKTTIINGERLHFDHPAIVVSNHPNTLHDVLNVACRVEKVVCFLANAGLFQSAFGNWFFSNLYCIPIQRSQDKGDRKFHVADSFAQCDAFLGSGGCLYIAPEGGSEMNRKLRGIKTGTARIALSSANKDNFQTQLAIIPVGLTYSAPTQFRSEVLLNVGEPIRIADYKMDYAADPVKTVQKITRRLEKALSNLIFNLTGPEEEHLISRMEGLLHSEAPLNAEDSWHRTKQVITYLRRWKKENSKEFENWKSEVFYYFNLLDNYVIEDSSLVSDRKDSSALQTNLRVLKVLAGFPVFLYGWINNFLANFIPAWLARKIKLYIGYRSTIKITAGLLTYLIFYSLQIGLVQFFFQNIWITLLYSISLPVTGLYAWKYKKEWEDWISGKRWRKLYQNHPEIATEMLDLRKQIMRKFKSKIAVKLPH